MKKYLFTILTLAIFIPSFAHADITSNLEVWYKANEGTGTTLTDSSGNGRTGLFSGSPSWAEGFVYPLAFNSPTRADYATSTATFSITQQTLSAWVKMASHTGESGHNIVISGSGSNNWLEVNTSGQVVFVSKANATFTDTNTTLSDGVWYMITATDDGANSVTGNIKIYINGVLDFSSTGLGSTRTEAYDVNTYGGSLGHFGMLGSVNNVRVYSRALTAGDVTDLYNNDNTPDYLSNLVNHWTFDEGSGTTAADSISGNTTDLNNGATWTTGKIGANAMLLDGTNDYAKSRSNLATGNDFTVAGWVFLNGAQVAFARFLETSFSSAFYMGLDTNHTKFESIIRNASVSVAGVATTSEWIHFAMTFNSASADQRNRNYINGVLVTPIGLGTALTQTALPLYFGTAFNSAGSSSNLKGDIDDVCIYNRVLSARDIAGLYNSTSGCAASTPPATTITPRIILNGMMYINSMIFIN